MRVERKHKDKKEETEREKSGGKENDWPRGKQSQPIKDHSEECEKEDG